MPRWRALPDELDPQVREFASQLRRLVDRGGLSIAAVADRTGYSKTSWERYLNGRLLAPKGAIVALAEVTGTNPVHLTTMWELAERAWSRSEARHDMTMEAIRISQARAALGEFGPTPAKGGRDAKQARAGGSAPAAPTPGIAGPAGVVPTVPPQNPGPAREDEHRTPYRAGASGGEGGSAGAGAGPGSGSGSGSGTGVRGGGWGVVASPPGGAGASGAGSSGFGPSGAFGPNGSAGSAVPNGPAVSAGSAGGPPQDARPAPGGPSDGQRRKRRLTMFLAGVVAALVVVAVAVYVTNSAGGKGGNEAKPTPSPTVSKELPAGVECSGADCTGKDPENMGCGGTLAQTVEKAVVGTAQVEVRYSETCGAAWARITAAAAGDSVRITAGSAAGQTAEVDTDTDAYTPMVAVKSATGAKACATLQSGQEGCTK
ncbi:DUF2690 domain-containing protein [Streptomyces sp. CWNU-52B]|uniref:helix-turn-helix domain-containing protein n=1 Tax=unclassified Streptomyces TaxID=2593676 RepID=UPI0039C02838